MRKNARVTTGIAAFGSVATVGSVNITFKSNLWIQWAEIAIEQEHAATEARSRARRLRAASEDYSQQLGAEMKATMVTVAAAAHSLDAMYGDVKALIQVPQTVLAGWRQGKAGRHSRIRETFRLGFALNNSRCSSWKRDFTWLWGLRDGAVHFEGRCTSAVAHEFGGVSAEAAMYSTEAAERAVTLMLDVLTAVTAEASAKTPELKGHATVYRPAVNRLIHLRGSTRLLVATSP
jgi:hypothetical protein